jgi:hypothetical protein
MNATKALVHQLAGPNLSINQRAQLRCQLASQLEDEGDYEAAREAMGELWQRVGERPLLEELAEETKGSRPVAGWCSNRMDWERQADQWSAGNSQESDQ